MNANVTSLTLIALSLLGCGKGTLAASTTQDGVSTDPSLNHFDTSAGPSGTVNSGKAANASPSGKAPSNVAGVPDASSPWASWAHWPCVWLWQSDKTAYDKTFPTPPATSGLNLYAASVALLPFLDSEGTPSQRVLWLAFDAHQTPGTRLIVRKADQAGGTDPIVAYLPYDRSCEAGCVLGVYAIEQRLSFVVGDKIVIQSVNDRGFTQQVSAPVDLQDPRLHIEKAVKNSSGHVDVTYSKGFGPCWAFFIGGTSYKSNQAGCDATTSTTETFFSNAPADALALGNTVGSVPLAEQFGSFDSFSLRSNVTPITVN